MKESLWEHIRKGAPVIFPTLSVLLTVLIALTPLYEKSVEFVISTSFIRFALFWFLGVAVLFSQKNTRIKPYRVAFRATLLSLGALALYCVVSYKVNGALQLNDVLFDSLSGALLGALAGTWAKYILEVYSDVLFDEL